MSKQVMDALPSQALSDNNFCLNYFRAIVETHALIREPPLFCLPLDITLPGLMRQYLVKRASYKRANDTPPIEDPVKVGATEDVLNFLRDAYPCTAAAR
jgi:hypothetical protein